MLYDGPRDPELLVAFLNAKCGTVRALDGSLQPEAALLATMAEVVNDFLAVDAESGQPFSDKALAAARVAAAALHGTFADNGRVYLKVMLCGLGHATVVCVLLCIQCVRISPLFWYWHTCRDRVYVHLHAFITRAGVHGNVS